MRTLLILGAALFTVVGSAQAQNLTTYIQAGQAQNVAMPAGDAGLSDRSAPFVRPSSAQPRNYQALATGRSLRVTSARHRVVR